MSILLFLSLAAGSVSLVFEDRALSLGSLSVLTNVFELLLVVLLLIELLLRTAQGRWRPVFLRRRLPAIGSGVGSLALLIVGKLAALELFGVSLGRLAIYLVVARAVVLLVLGLRKSGGLVEFLDYLHEHPAQTIVLSFFLVVVSGTVLLMMPFTSSDGHGLSFVNALFTSTSAVCVTGLVVVDTVTAFSLAGKIVILLLIQVGGLGIMILAFFTIYVFREGVSFEDRALISYAVSERHMGEIRDTVRRIIGITFAIEAAGAALLFVGFSQVYGPGSRALFYAIFHSVSAFCNAGFALYSNSLVGFVGNPWICGTIAALIILGGLSFVVLIDVAATLNRRLGRLVHRNTKRPPKLSLNTKVVLSVTILLIVGGTLLIYATEHGNTLRRLPVGVQYFAAFFQSVTLRTAGFNSIPFASLTTVSYLVMIVFMFIGGASGSTAGGIKVGTVAVVYSAVASLFRNRRHAVLFRHAIPTEVVLRAASVFVFGVSVVTLGTAILSVSDHQPLLKLLFEATSAFGTVGLSTGITSSLSVVGRVVISMLMFTGRIGSLTVIAAASRGRSRGNITYPTGEVSIG